MKLKLCVCLVLGILVAATQAVAAPIFTPFLSVDIDGQGGPTRAGFTSFPVASGGLTPWALQGGTTGINLLNVPTSEGNVSVNMKGIAPGSNRDARNRGANSGALTEVTQDFVFANRGVDGFGQHFIKLEISGLSPGQTYEVTMFNRDHFNGDASEMNSSWQAYTDRNALGGLDGPGAWMEANVGDGDPNTLELYQPTYGTDPNAAGYGVYKNPVPTLTRIRLSGPDDPNDPYAYADSFFSTADGGGIVTVYGWADPQSYSGTQTVSLLNGFEVGLVPEPGSVILALIGVVSSIGLRRRVC